MNSQASRQIYDPVPPPQYLFPVKMCAFIEPVSPDLFQDLLDRLNVHDIRPVPHILQPLRTK